MDIGDPIREETREPARLVPGIRPKEQPTQPEPVRVEPEREPVPTHDE